MVEREQIHSNWLRGTSMNTFNQFLKEANSESNRDVVGLAIYYLHTYGEEDVVTVSEIRDLFDIYNVSMSETAVAAHFAELSDEDLITESSRESLPYVPQMYLLTRAGFRMFGRIAGEWGIYGVRDGRFIDTERVDDDDYELLISNINRSYRNEINDGTLVLTRKLFENLIIDILRAEFGGSNIDLYFNTNWNQHHGLGRLCSNLRDEINNLNHYSRQLDDDLIDRVEEFKEEGNTQAHSVRIGVSDQKLESLSAEATDLTNILWILREEVRNANS